MAAVWSEIRCLTERFLTWPAYATSVRSDDVTGADWEVAFVNSVIDTDAS